MQQDTTTNTTAGQVAFPCLPLSDADFEEAVYHLHVRARSDAPGFDCATSNVGDMAGEAIALVVSQDGTRALLPRWQYDALWIEYVDTLVTKMWRRGRQ